MRDTADVVVVGAGPAGATVALLLARAGHDVALLDRAPFPRLKPCGDCLSPAANRVLERLGVLDDVQALEPARLHGWRIVSPSGFAFEAGFADAARADPLVSTSLALPRDRLDAALLDAAAAAGARVSQGLRVLDVLRDESGVAGVSGSDAAGEPFEVRARLVIGADGLRSTVARRLRLLRRPPRLRKLSLTAHVRGIDGVGARGEMHIGDGVVAGLAPVSSSAADVPCNLTIVVDAERYGRSVAADAGGFLMAVAAGLPRLAGRLPPGVGQAPLLASGPFDWPTRGVVVDGAALVGDAAGYYDPFTGQGIHQALVCGEQLAETADSALRAGRPTARRLRPYAARQRRLVGDARRLQRLIELVTSRPGLADRAVRRLARSPRAAETLIATAGDLRPARSLLSPTTILDLFVPSPRPEARP